MSELTDFYQEQAIASRSDIAWLAHLQKDALADLKRTGFPTRKHEDWKYTSLDGFLQQRFVSAGEDIATADTSGQTDAPIACHKIGIHHGIVAGSDALVGSLPAGVVVLPLAEAMVSHPEKIKPYLGRILKQEHGFHALNTAMLYSGLFVYLPKGVCLTAPLLLAHWHDKSQHATYLRHLVIAEPGSSVCIIEDYQGAPSVDYFTSAITEVFAAANATVTHYKIQRESQSAVHMGHLAISQAAGSQVNSHLFSFGGKLVRSDTTFTLDAPHAQCFMNGIYAPTDGQHMDHHTRVTHAVADCSSVQDYKGILSGHSRAVFNGQVIVAKGAQHTSAQQQNKNLLLSVGAEIDTKPQLEIFADDVVCTHGATVGQLDEDALFYLATRGIERAEAQQYLVRAFAAENIRAVTDPALSEWLGQLLTRQIGCANE
ncbi:MAG TPA: Fe-S cluster assembly protein SufD [Legionella sp.]|nr:Fe-S cluster assembly protein SufD [Legionella sp.]